MTQCLKFQIYVSPFIKRLRVIIALAGVAAANVSLAQDLPDGGRINLGETDLYPSIRLEFGTNDNAFLESSNEEETSRFSVKPGLVWIASQGSTILQAEYLGDYSTHSESALDYQNHDLSLDASTVLSRQWRVAASAGVKRNSFELGGTRTLGIGRNFDEPFTFNDWNFAAFATFGANGARGNIEFGFRARELDPVNLPQISEGFAYTSFSPFALFSLRLSSDTRLTFETRVSSFDYDFDLSDRQDVTYLLGLRFVATGRLSGFFNIGATQLSFDNAGNEDRTDAVASASIRFDATESARFRFTARRDIDDASAINDTGDLGRISTLLRLQWNQQFSERLSHVAFVESEIIDLDCPSRGSSRVSLGYQLGLSVRRWFEIGGFVDSRTRDFDACDAQLDADIDYTSQRLGIFIKMTL